MVRDWFTPDAASKLLQNVKLTPTSCGFIAELPDFPGVFSEGKDEENAKRNVLDALITMHPEMIQNKHSL
jgi:predicted RNase H-like HicB family nuclease